MALFRSRGKAAGLAIPQIPRTATYIEEGCTLSGQLQFQSGVRIDGHIEGEVRARGTVVVGESGVVDASIFADMVVVLGEVEGDITAQTLVALHKGARVRSDISTAGIVVEPGSNFLGSIVIGAEEVPALAEEAGVESESEADTPSQFEDAAPIVKIRANGKLGAVGSAEAME
ncbi:MAG: polymer-forming cytoskeletal protein [Deltaproteobacteria bacterium]|nr:polymer-forming cytoskeletal protein [Deltaproteobacteria bacterium]MBW2445594.1 polymer-forming cytoskeletal protein [Deltaproteobacteria bacterium]